MNKFQIVKNSNVRELKQEFTAREMAYDLYKTLSNQMDVKTTLLNQAVLITVNEYGEIMLCSQQLNPPEYLNMLGVLQIAVDMVTRGYYESE